MKKILLTGLALLILNSPVNAFPIYMPDYKKGNECMDVSFWKKHHKGLYWILPYKEGIINTWGRNNQPIYRVAFSICDRVKIALPFYIHQVQKDILYLDNKPTDRVIDKIIPNPESHAVGRYAPDCLEK